MGFKERAAKRRKRMVVHEAKNFAEAEESDLDFWLSFTPEERPSIHSAMALAVQREMKKIMRERAQNQTYQGSGKRKRASSVSRCR